MKNNLEQNQLEGNNTISNTGDAYIEKYFNKCISVRESRDRVPISLELLEKREQQWAEILATDTINITLPNQVSTGQDEQWDVNASAAQEEDKLHTSGTNHDCFLPMRSSPQITRVQSLEAVSLEESLNSSLIANYSATSAAKQDVDDSTPFSSTNRKKLKRLPSIAMYSCKSSPPTPPSIPSVKDTTPEAEYFQYHHLLSTSTFTQNGQSYLILDDSYLDQSATIGNCDVYESDSPEMSSFEQNNNCKDCTDVFNCQKHEKQQFMKKFKNQKRHHSLDSMLSGSSVVIPVIPQKRLSSISGSATTQSTDV